MKAAVLAHRLGRRTTPPRPSTSAERRQHRGSPAREPAHARPLRMRTVRPHARTFRIRKPSRASFLHARVSVLREKPRCANPPGAARFRRCAEVRVVPDGTLAVLVGQSAAPVKAGSSVGFALRRFAHRGFLHGEAGFSCAARKIKGGIHAERPRNMAPHSCTVRARDGAPELLVTLQVQHDTLPSTAMAACHKGCLLRSNNAANASLSPCCARCMRSSTHSPPPRSVTH